MEPYLLEKVGYSMQNQNFQLVSSCKWHNRYLGPLAEGLKKRGHNVRLSCGTSFHIEKDWYSVCSYHEDLFRVMGSKKIFFLEHAISFVKSAYGHSQIILADYVLVQGSIFSQWLRFCHPNVNQLKAGFPRIEALYRQPDTRKEIIEKHNLNSDAPIVVYAPTWSNLKSTWGGSLEEAYPILKSLNLENLLILPHPSCSYGHQIARKDSRVLTNVDSYYYLRGCDLLIGDNSSLLLEFTVRDKPIVQLDRFGDFRGLLSWYTPYKKIDAWKFKNLFNIYQLGEITTLDKNKISRAIEDALKNPNKYKPYREYWKSLAMYNLENPLESTLNCIEGVL